MDAELALCDETGQIVGHYVPADLYRKMLYAVAAAEITDQEVEEARQQTGGQRLGYFWNKS